MKLVETPNSLTIYNPNIGYLVYLFVIPAIFVSAIIFFASIYGFNVIVFIIIGVLLCLMAYFIIGYRSYKLELNRNTLSKLTSKNLLMNEKIFEFNIADIEALTYDWGPSLQLATISTGKLEFLFNDGKWFTVAHSVSFANDSRRGPIGKNLPIIESFLGIKVDAELGLKRKKELYDKVNRKLW
jgi:hypothetical protein